MNICIVVHSFTGNTLMVAEKLASRLREKGHTVDLERLEVVGGEDRNQQNIDKISFNKILDLSGYDRVFIAGPVRGFSISPVLKSWISKTGSLQGKKLAIFVTHAFPYSFMGGKSAISQIESVCREKGAAILDSEVIDWGNKKRDKQIEDLVTRFEGLM